MTLLVSKGTIQPCSTDMMQANIHTHKTKMNKSSQGNIHQEESYNLTGNKKLPCVTSVTSPNTSSSHWFQAAATQGLVGPEPCFLQHRSYLLGLFVKEKVFGSFKEVFFLFFLPHFHFLMAESNSSCKMNSNTVSNMRSFQRKSQECRALDVP